MHMYTHNIYKFIYIYNSLSLNFCHKFESVSRGKCISNIRGEFNLIL